jgi:hypothetical protein
VSSIHIFLLAAFLLVSAVMSLPNASAITDTDRDEIKSCLSNWPNHPFKGEQADFRVLTSSVKVLGIGEDLNDLTKTAEPRLILVKPNVSVMSKSQMNLLNPNGWYCLKGKVSVLAKTEINIGCATHITSSASGTTVLGASEGDTGVTVLGKTVINKIGCAATGHADSKPAQRAAPSKFSDPISGH